MRSRATFLPNEWSKKKIRKELAHKVSVYDCRKMANTAEARKRSMVCVRASGFGGEEEDFEMSKR